MERFLAITEAGSNTMLPLGIIFATGVCLIFGLAAILRREQKRVNQLAIAKAHAFADGQALGFTQGEAVGFGNGYTQCQIDATINEAEAFANGKK